jgi:hypothetical protein
MIWAIVLSGMLTLQSHGCIVLGMNNAELLTTAITKSNAHLGLADALDYGTVRVLRVDGVDHIYATGDDGRTFDCTVDVYAIVRCNGYIVSSTCGSLALAALRAARRH